MGLRLLLDEHVEREVRHRLEDRGHDVEHVSQHDTLSGESDRELARYSSSERRIIVTYDDDFLDLPESAYHCVLFFEDESTSGSAVADIVHAVSEHVPEGELRGLQKVGRDWL